MNAKLFRPLILSGALALGAPVVSSAAFADGNITFAPPELPQYAQPPCPDVGYIWTPGYWHYLADQQEYYWVAGSWVLAPEPGLLWTPGYWSDGGWGGYAWHAGYWAPHVGFYGGINYGFGYFGVGFQGGYWHDRMFYYNRAVTNINNWHITNVYNQTSVRNQYSNSRLSFNGARGVHARPNAVELIAAREPHRGLSDAQRHGAPAPSHALVSPHTTAMNSRYVVNYPSSKMTARPAPVRFESPQRKSAVLAKTSVREPIYQSAQAKPTLASFKPIAMNRPKPVERDIHRGAARIPLTPMHPRAVTAQARPSTFREPARHMDVSTQEHAHRKA